VEAVVRIALQATHKIIANNIDFNRLDIGYPFSEFEFYFNMIQQGRKQVHK
jgi:hypothetical protein